jgi:hypothetical protein
MQSSLNPTIRAQMERVFAASSLWILPYNSSSGQRSLSARPLIVNAKSDRSGLDEFVCKLLKELEARAGIEAAHKGFADHLLLPQNPRIYWVQL